MFDLWTRDTEIVTLLAVSGLLLILPIQLALCFKAKKLLVKLLPTILLAVATLAFYAMVFVLKERSAIGYAILGIFSSVLLFFDGLAWGILAITKLIKKSNCKPTA